MAYENWYSVVENTDQLLQGDLIPSCWVPTLGSDVPLEPNENDEIPITLESVNLIVLNQSCDLEHGHVDHILLARYDTWDDVVKAEVAKGNEKIKGQSHRKALLDGTITSHFLLPPQVDEPRLGWAAVNFRILRTLPRDYVMRKALSLGRRRRIESPYRESLSQAFARFTMRVALTETLDEFARYAPNAEITAAQPVRLTSS